MKVFIYWANSPPSPVIGSYVVTVSYCHTSYTFNKVYPICTAFCNSTDTPKCLRELDRQLNDYMLIDSQFLHTFCTIQTSTFYLYEMVVVECVILWEVILYILYQALKFIHVHTEFPQVSVQLACKLNVLHLPRIVLLEESVGNSENNFIRVP